MKPCLTALFLVLATTLGRAQGQQNLRIEDPASSTPTVQIALEDPARVLLASPKSDPTQASTPDQTPTAPTPKDNGFFHRLGRTYVADWANSGPATAVPQSPRRGTPAPIFSPPYPAADWPIGGTPVIGAPDGQTYPLMQALNENKSANKIYGYIEVGGNGSTNNKGNSAKGLTANAPAAYDAFP